MKNKFLKRILIFTIIIMMLCTSPSFAAIKFVPGTNSITKSQYISGVDFEIDKTGIYSITLLPVIEGYEWKYTISTSGENLNLALVQDGVNDKDEPIYKLYSDDIPYVLLMEGKTYNLKLYSQNQKNKLVTEASTAENYITVRLSSPIENEDGKYYEAKKDKAKNAIDDLNKMQLYFENAMKNGQQNDLQDPPNNAKKYEILGGEQKADFVQQLLTSFFVDVIGDGIMFLIGVVAGEPITIDKILFNEYSRTRLAFFVNDIVDENGVEDQNKINPFLADTGLLPKGSNEGTLNKFYNRFMLIAIVVYVVMLLYMGIRTVLSSTGRDMAKYKKLFADWVGGILILFLFPYVMRYTIKINNALVGYVGSLRSGVASNIEEAEIIDYPGGLAFPFSYVGSDGVASLDYMSIMRQTALETGRILYALCWLLMLKELISFLIIYMKRLLTTMFLIVIFPLVTISYAIDKIGDGKSQAFNNWVKEYILNVFLQLFHAINYVVVMGIIFAVGKTSGQTNFILIIIGLTYLAQGDKILRGIFSHMKGGGGGTVKDVAESMLATMGVVNMVRDSAATIGKGIKNVKNLSDKRLEMKNMSTKLSERKANDKWDEWNLRSVQSAGQRGGETAQTDQRISNDIDTVLDKRSSAERIQQSVGALRQASMAGGETQARYEEKMRQLQSEDPERYNELMDLMDQSDAVDAMQNLDQMAEAEINANLNVLVKNRRKGGNFEKLNAELNKNGLTNKAQDQLLRKIQARELTGSQEANLNKIRGSICTKQDRARLFEIRRLEREAKEITDKQTKLEKNKVAIDAKRAELEGKISRLERDLKVTGKKKQKGKKSSIDAQIAEYRRELGKLDEYEESNNRSLASLQANGLSYAERRRLFEISEEKKAIEATLTNKNLTTKDLKKKDYDKGAQVAKYRLEAQRANGGMISDEQAELAEAQAVLDGSDSGNYTLEEIWEATKTVRKAKKKEDKDEGIKKILEVAQGDSKTAKPEGFDEQVAALVVKNKKVLAKNSNEHEAATFEQEAKKVLKERAEELRAEKKEDAVYQNIIDDHGIGVKRDKKNGIEIISIHEGGSVKQEVQTIQSDMKKEIAKNRAAVGNALTDADSVEMMRTKLFQERLEFTGAAIKTASAPLVTTVTGLASAAMVTGASGEYSVKNAIAAGKFGSDISSTVKNKAVDFTSKRVERVADKISGMRDVAKNADTTTTEGSSEIARKLFSTLIFADDNQQGVETITVKLEKNPIKQQINQQQATRMKEIDEKIQQLERIEQNRERLRQSLSRSSRNSSTGSGDDEETNNS